MRRWCFSFLTSLQNISYFTSVIRLKVLQKHKKKKKHDIYFGIFMLRTQAIHVHTYCRYSVRWCVNIEMLEVQIKWSLLLSSYSVSIFTTWNCWPFMFAWNYEGIITFIGISEISASRNGSDDCTIGQLWLLGYFLKKIQGTSHPGGLAAMMFHCSALGHWCDSRSW